MSALAWVGIAFCVVIIVTVIACIWASANDDTMLPGHFGEKSDTEEK